MGKMNVTNDMMLSLFAEMVLDESLRRTREEQLHIEIDRVLAEGDEESFIALTTELNALRAMRTH